MSTRRTRLGLAAVILLVVGGLALAQRGGGRRGGGGTGMRGGPGMGRGAASSFDSQTLPNTDVERRILAVLRDLEGGRWMENVPPEDGRLLRVLTEAIGAKHVVEIGTSNGYSGLWLSLALRSTGGKLTTHEIAPERVALARENFRRAGVDDIATVVEGDAHETVTRIKEPIDLLFIDADKEGYLDYLNKLLPLVRPGGLLVAHNMNVAQADPRYVEAITKNPALETIFLHMEATGVGVTLKKR
jgi:predicted O-methyltransferase YrrM